MLTWSILFAASLATSVAAQVQFLGVAIAGGDFGCQIDGSCPTGSTQIPLGGSGGGGGDGAGQMQHWASLPKPFNMFRLPVSWQFLANNQIGGTLDANNLAKYDQLVQQCLSTGAYCMIDIHNFARVDGAIIGQGGPTDDDFASLWSQLATKYASEEKMVFELMNEPHDLDINVWAATCQKAVTGIRNAGATSQMVLLPGTNFDSAAMLVSSGSAAALMNITNVDGTTDNLLLDIHKYLDEDNSGTHAECTTNNIDAFTTVAQFLRQAGRQGLVSESGASSDSTCLTNFCAQNAFINQNADVFVGLVGWGAGSFDTSYILSMTPSKQNNQFVDNSLVQECMIDIWASTVSTGAPPASPPPTIPAAPPSPAPTAPSTVYITPLVFETLAPDRAPTAPKAIAASAVTGAATLDWAKISAEVGAGLSVEPLETAAPKRATGPMTTLVVALNSTGTVVDSLWIATGSQNLTAAATLMAGAAGEIVTGGSLPGVGRGPSLGMSVLMGVAAFFFSL